MKNKEKIKLFCEQYYFEHERHEKLISRLGIPITVLTLIFGIIAFFLKSVLPLKFEIWFIVFYVLFAFVVIFTAFVVYHLIKSYYNYDYSYLPFSVDLKKDFDNIRKYYDGPYFNELSVKQKERKIEETIDELLINYYIESNVNNTKNNDTKAKHLHLATTSLIRSIIFFFLCSIPLLIIINDSTDYIEKVKIINFQEIEDIMSDKKKKEKPKPPPPKPKPSGIRNITEGEDKSKKKNE